jgi:IclR family acetate operon transcriptional repressor
MEKYMAKTRSKSESMSMNDGVQSVERALDLLELLARSSDWAGISELSAASGQPVGTVHRLLMTLVARGYAIRDSRRRRYALGSAARLLAGANPQTLNWAEIAAPFLRQLVEISGETANIVVMEHHKAVYVAQVQSARMVRMFTELGNRVPLHSTGCGKVLLAYQADSVRASIIVQTGLPASTYKTITDPDQLQHELEMVRQQGYAIDNGEQEEGVHCFAVPVHDPEGKVIAAMSISGPSSRLDNTRVPFLVQHLKRASADLSAKLLEVRSTKEIGA